MVVEESIAYVRHEEEVLHYVVEESFESHHEDWHVHE
jgi:hypothetical protein